MGVSIAIVPVSVLAQGCPPGEQADDNGSDCAVVVHVVRIDGLADAAAQRAALRRLDEAGVGARAEGSRAVQVGVFPDEALAEERLMDLIGMGFRSVGIYRVERGEGDVEFASDASEGGSAREKDEPDAFNFGDSDADDGSASDSRSEARSVRFEVDDLEAHGAYLPRSSQPVETFSDAVIGASVRWLPQGPWEARVGARLDAWWQTARDHDDADVDTAWGEADYTDNWIRYRAAWGRVTAGTQAVRWGTMDFDPPSDRLSVVDLTGGPAEAIDGGRRSSPSLRLETYGPVDVDVLLTPVFRPAELPRKGTLWHPVDQRRGRLLGIPDTPLVRELVRSGRFEHDPGSAEQDVVGGVRLSQAGRNADWGATVQSARRTAPYYALTEDARGALAAGGPAAVQNVDGETFEARYPRSLIIGGDLAVDAAGVTWRLEGVWSSDEPATRERDLKFVTRPGLDWAAGAEFFPGDGNLRVSLQLTGQHLLNAGDVLDPTDTVRLGGELEQPWARERWHTRLRFQVGLDRSDVYISPEVAWSVTDNQELTLSGHYFHGADDAVGGFFEDHDMVRLGWQIHL